MAALRIGISQGHGGAMVIEGARAFVRALGTLLGQEKTTRLHVADDYAALKAALKEGQIDLGWMPPFLHIEAVRWGAKLLAVVERDGALTYRSSIVVRADSEIRRLEDIHRARVAWTDASSASGYVFPRLHLLGAGLDPKEAFAHEDFLGSPRGVCGAVADGQADLGACFTSEKHADDVKLALVDVARIYPAATWRLRVLAVTEPIPSDGLVAAAHVPAPARYKLVDALLRLHNIADGTEAMTKLFFGERLVAPSTAVTRAIERLAPRLVS
jgi:phosphonate transport system substrate-binding protein